MIVFTTMGLLWFWLGCFEMGRFLAWAADTDGIVMACASVLFDCRKLAKSARDCIVYTSGVAPTEGGQQ
jgi:hypothetical protein